LPLEHESLRAAVLDESIRRHLRSALDAIASRERDQRSAEVGGTDARVAARIRAMHPVIEALRALSHETIADLTIFADTHGQTAQVEMVESAGSRHSLAISTDAENRRFEVEENQYFPLSGDRASYVHWFETPEDLLRFVLEMIGTHIAARQVLAEKHI
jgi:hypothetical protein